MDDPKRLYQCLLDYCSHQTIERLSIGLVWTVCQAQQAGGIDSGLAMTPAIATRTLSWPGTLAGRSLKDVGAWVLNWEPYQATVGMAALNCGINHSATLPTGLRLETRNGTPNLTVFEYFLPLTLGQKVVVIGHYPGLDVYVEQNGWQVLERQPLAGDYPDPAAEFLLPEADWVFLSASTIPNKTFPRLAQLARSAKTVLMGPTVPWLPELYDFGIDYLAGVEVVEPDELYQTAAEGGGVRIFTSSVRYRVLELNPANNLAWLKHCIATTYADKEFLTQAMTQWYDQGHHQRFPRYADLQAINDRLSRLDSAYKTLWDEQQS